MLGFDVVQDIIPVDIWFSEDWINTHFMMIKFASIGYKILENDGWKLKVDGESFGGKISGDGFTDLLFGSFDVGWSSFPHWWGNRKMFV